MQDTFLPSGPAPERSATRTVIPLNTGWEFAWGGCPGAEGGPAGPGPAEAGKPEPEWYDALLPHSFSLPDYREAEFYVGYGCYRRTLDVAEADLQRMIALEFLGVFQRAEVFVNGERAGGHVGGYTAFLIEIGGLLRPGLNLVVVRVDNLWNPRVAPRAGDYSFSGGIYRDVNLVVTDPVRVDWHGTFVRTPVASHERAEVHVTTSLRAPERTGATRVAYDVRRDAETVARGEVTVAWEAGSAEADVTMAIAEPALWTPDTPHLYRLRTRVYVDDVLRDEVLTDFGVRWFSWSADDGFFLNGSRVELHGANVHQNHGGWADAVTRSGIRRDIALVKDAGLNSIRGSHYPHHETFAAECDTQGVLFWSELCFWGIGGENVEGYWFASSYPIAAEDEADFEAHVEQTLREMIAQNRNHASIFVWSVGNEAFFADDAVIPKAKALTRRLVEICHELDPTRAAAVGGAQRKGFDVLGDVAGYNGDGAAMFLAPGIPSVVAEYHGNKGARPGEWETTFEFGVEQPYAWRAGKFLWSAFHYKTIVRTGGFDGIVDYWRMPRRAWHWYRKTLRGIEPPAEPATGSAAGLRIFADAGTFAAGGRDDVQLIVRTVDADGRWVAAEPVAVDVAVEFGPGLLPSSEGYRLSPRTESFRAGEGAIELRAYAAGVIVVRARSAGLADGVIELIATGAPPSSAAYRHAPSAPTRQRPPGSRAQASVAAYRPVRASSQETGFEARYVTEPGADTCWRPADDDPAPWVIAGFEFDYEIERVEVSFVEELGADPLVELLTAEGPVALAGGRHPDSRRLHLEFAPTVARGVRLSFPNGVAGVGEIRAV